MTLKACQLSKGEVFSLQLNYIMDYDESNEIDFPDQIFQGYKIINTLESI